MSQRSNKNKYIQATGLFNEMISRKTAVAVLNLPKIILENIKEEDKENILASKTKPDINSNCEENCNNCRGKIGECIII